MLVRGRITIGPYATGSKSARDTQAFLVTEDGARLELRRYDGPSMRDDHLIAMDGQEVEAEGLLRDQLFIARSLRCMHTAVTPAPTARRRGHHKP
jgi:hypothetical protein